MLTTRSLIQGFDRRCLLEVSVIVVFVRGLRSMFCSRRCSSARLGSPFVSKGMSLLTNRSRIQSLYFKGLFWRFMLEVCVRFVFVRGFHIRGYARGFCSRRRQIDAARVSARRLTFRKGCPCPRLEVVSKASVAGFCSRLLFEVFLRGRAVRRG